MKRTLPLLVFVGCVSFSDAESDPAPAPAPADDGGSDGGTTQVPDADTQPDRGASDASIDAGPPCQRRIDERFLSAIGTSWKTPELHGGGSMTFVTSGGANGGGAARATIVSDADYGVARIEQVFPAPLPERATLTFSMNVASHASTYSQLGCVLQAAASNVTFFAAYPKVSSGNLRGEASNRTNSAIGTSAEGPSATLKPGKWYSVRIQLEELTSLGAKVIMDIDGTQQVNQAFTFPAEAVELRVRCGVEYTDPEGTAVVDVDDVVFDVCP